MEHCWPNKNIILKHCNLTWFDYISRSAIRKNLILLLLPLLILLLFALSQAGTSLFLLTRFGFSHPVSILFASMVCICLTAVYFQKISINFRKKYFKNFDSYKSFKDLYRSFNSVTQADNSISHLEKIQVMWLLMQHRHIVKKFRIEADKVDNIDVWFKKQVLLAQHQLGGERFKLKLYDLNSNIYAWSNAYIHLEKNLINLFKKYEINADKDRQRIKSTLALYHWRCLESSKRNQSDIIEILRSHAANVPEKDWQTHLGKISDCEHKFLKATTKYMKDDTNWFEKIKFQRVNIDHKLNPDPDLFALAMFFATFGGIGNMVVGNNLIGLYGSIAGVAALISFYPILHLSITVKIVVALFGCLSAAFASFSLTWPMLIKLLKQFTRWRMRSKARSLLGQNTFTWLSSRSVDWRILVCFLFAGVVTLSAVNFNMYATWHLTNRLIALFPGTPLARYLAHMPWILKFILTSIQAIISFLCAGAIYFTSCFNQYVGQSGKTKLKTISVLDKIYKYFQQRSWSKVIQLVIVVSCSALAAFAQTIIWFHGVTSNPIYFILLTFPSALAFFATFCEAALACLDSETSFNWVSNDCLKGWLSLPNQQVKPISFIDRSKMQIRSNINLADNDDNNSNGLSIET